MHTHKTGKAHAVRALTLATMDRSSEEALMLKGWAASDSARILDDLDWDESQDQSDMGSLAQPRHRYDA